MLKLQYQQRVKNKTHSINDVLKLTVSTC